MFYTLKLHQVFKFITKNTGKIQMFHRVPFFHFFCIAIMMVCSRTFAIDKSKYISINEITPGMNAYTLTVYQGVEPSKYNLKVVSVIKNIAPNRNAILVIGTDEAFIHSGPVAGCSGSPVYIDGRLAGALSFGWTFSKDPLYGVTPIEEMLQAGASEPSKAADASASSSLDFSKPINFQSSYDKLINNKSMQQFTAGINQLVCPIATNLPQSSLSNLNKIFESSGFIAVSTGSSAADFSQYADVPMKPGGIIALPLVSGDIDLSAIGTITEVADGKIYAFGHGLLGQGPIDVPMATGYVHTVVASMLRSFKLGQPIAVKGALYTDQSAAVVGTLGKKAQTIPMTIQVESFSDRLRTYNCQIAHHNTFTPLLTGICLSGTATMAGELPPENTLQYKVKIGIKGYSPVILENFSSSNNLQDYVSDSVGALNILMNNPYDRPQITSLDFEVKIEPRNSISHLWNFQVSQTNVKPGQIIEAQITLETFLSSNKTYNTEITIPHDIPAGEYTLTAGGIEQYMMFVVMNAPFKFTPENLPHLIKIINEVGNKKRNSLYLTLELPPSGIAIESSQLPNLPVTKSLLLKNSKRAVSARPDAQWIERIIPTDTVVLDSKSITITVKKD